MSTLSGGTLIDQISSSIAGSDVSESISFSSHIHSLPATVPDYVVVEMTSLDTVGIINGPPALLRMGANASVITMGYAYGSAASTPTVAFTITSVVVWSAAR